MSSGDLDPPQAQPLPELRELAESAARAGGELARSSFGETRAVSLKTDGSEVTEIDVAAERAIILHIRSQRPTDLFVGEETLAESREAAACDGPAPTDTAERQSPFPSPQSPIVNRQSSIGGPQSVFWIIDPLDGTRNYIRNVPLFACSVAAMRDGVPIAGAIYDPIGNAMYSADAAAGAYVDGKRFSLKRAARPSTGGATGKLIVAVPSARHPSGQELVRAVFERHVVRNLGCTALHLAMVATGRFDAAVTSNCRLWDIAAGWLIITQAGGTMTGPTGRPLFPLDVATYAGQELPALAGSPWAHAELLTGAGVEDRKGR